MSRAIIALNTGTIAGDLAKLGRKCTIAEGCYKGLVEHSYILDDVTARTLRYLRRLGKQQHQECIMFIDDDDNSWLVYCDGYTRSEMIGKWREESRELARQLDSYTRVNDKYYIVKEDL